jgi:hypothetical protein
MDARLQDQRREHSGGASEDVAQRRKMGSGGHATCNDVAFLLPPNGAPKIVVAYYTASCANGDQCYAVLAEVGRIVSTGFG